MDPDKGPLAAYSGWRGNSSIYRYEHGVYRPVEDAELSDDELAAGLPQFELGDEYDGTSDADGVIELDWTSKRAVRRGHTPSEFRRWKLPYALSLDDVNAVLAADSDEATDALAPPEWRGFTHAVFDMSGDGGDTASLLAELIGQTLSSERSELVPMLIGPDNYGVQMTTRMVEQLLGGPDAVLRFKSPIEMVQSKAMAKVEAQRAILLRAAPGFRRGHGRPIWDDGVATIRTIVGMDRAAADGDYGERYQYPPNVVIWVSSRTVPQWMGSVHEAYAWEDHLRPIVFQNSVRMMSPRKLQAVLPKLAAYCTGLYLRARARARSEYSAPFFTYSESSNAFLKQMQKACIGSAVQFCDEKLTFGVVGSWTSRRALRAALETYIHDEHGGRMLEYDIEALYSLIYMRPHEALERQRTRQHGERKGSSLDGFELLKLSSEYDELAAEVETRPVVGKGKRLARRRR